MKTPSRILWVICWAFVATGAPAAELQLEGSRLLVTGVMDGSAVQALNDHLSSGQVRTVVFQDAIGGSAEAAGDYARLIRASGVNTEVKGQCNAACAYAFLAGKEHRFGRGLQVNLLLIPVATRPRAEDLISRWKGEESHRNLADFNVPPRSADTAMAAGAASAGAAPAIARWQPEHGVLFMSTPTLFGRVYNTLYCDGTQGRDTSRCESLTDADPHKLGVLTP